MIHIEVCPVRLGGVEGEFGGGRGGVGGVGVEGGGGGEEGGEDLELSFEGVDFLSSHHMRNHPLISG